MQTLECVEPDVVVLDVFVFDAVVLDALLLDAGVVVDDVGHCTAVVGLW